MRFETKKKKLRKKKITQKKWEKILDILVERSFD